MSGNSFIRELPTHYGAFNGNGIEYRIGGFPDGSHCGSSNEPVLRVEAPGSAFFKNNLMCRAGSANIDNTCICPGSLNSAPWQVESPVLQKNLTELDFGTKVCPLKDVPNCTARMLIKERGRY